MKAETIEKAIQDLVSVYGDDVLTAREGSRTLARVAEVEMPPGCRPTATSMLLVLDPAAEKPVAYVQPGQLLSNGRTARSTSAQMIGGESWMQFSFNIPWTEEAGIVRFIAAARQRFAQND
jgi:hypothetical protein